MAGRGTITHQQYRSPKYLKHQRADKCIVHLVISTGVGYETRPTDCLATCIILSGFGIILRYFLKSCDNSHRLDFHDYLEDP